MVNFQSAMWYNAWRMQWDRIVAGSYSYSIVLEPQQDGGYTVLVPALPEVVTEGENEEEALANAQDAIRLVLSYRKEQKL